MARQVINRGNFPNDHAHADPIYVINGKINDMTLDLYSLQSQILSAGDARFASLPTTEARIDAMLTACEVELKAIGAIPLQMIPYDTSLVGAHPTVRRVREGGDYSVYDIWAYGADALGVQNATNAIKAAIPSPNAVQGSQTASSRVLVVPPGSYLVDPIALFSLTDFTILLAAGATLRGSNPNSFIFQLWDCARARILGPGAISHDSRGPAQVPGADAIRIVNCTNIEVANAQCTTLTNSGVVITGSLDVRVTGCEVGTLRNTGLYVSNETGGLTSKRIVLRDNYVHDTDDDAIMVIAVTAYAAVEDVVVQGNRVFQTKKNGIITEGAAGVSIVGNTVRSTGGAGIRFGHDAAFLTRGSRRVTIADNIIVDANTYNATGSFAGIDGRCSSTAVDEFVADIQITDNQISGGAWRMISVGSAGAPEGSMRAIHILDNDCVGPNTSSFGVNVEICRDLWCNDNYIYQSRGEGIVVQDACTGHCEVIGNVVRDGNQAGTGGIPAIFVETIGAIIRQNEGILGTWGGGAISDGIGTLAIVEDNILIGFSVNIDATCRRRGNRFSAGASTIQIALVNGTATWSTAEIRTGDSLLLTRIVGAGTTRGLLTAGTIVSGTSVVIRSEDLAGALSADDDSTVFAEIVH